MQQGEQTHGDERQAPTNKRPVRLRIGVFYDGTGNNRVNTDERRANSAVYRRKSSGDDSYEGDASNVAEIERLVLGRAEKFDRYLPVYVEGIGTEDREKDSLTGFGLGTGDTGVLPKVQRGIVKAVDAVDRLGLDPNVYFLQYVAVDTCGFSRGAAAARCAVHYMLNDGRWRLKGRLQALGFEVGKVEVLAVGLFDTVSSYGTDHSDDVAELHLDAIRQAQAVYQLAAAEEYRTNFALTGIASAGKRGREVYLPGAHSDVGGGYRDRAPEAWDPLSTGPKSLPVARFLIERGWYRNTPQGRELVYTPAREGSYLPPRRGTEARVTTRRGPIRTAYTFIPRRLMARWLTDRGVPVNPRLFRLYTPDGVPWGVQIEQRGLEGKDTIPNYWERPSTGLAILRHGFLHVSFRDVPAQYTWGWLLPHKVNFDRGLQRPRRHKVTRG